MKPIEKSRFLPCSPARAFELLTQYAGTWWPLDRRHTGDAQSEIRIEASGRFYERARDGREVELGVVRVFAPPERLVLDWFPGTGPQNPTHVEIRLVAEGAGTRVELIHREGPNSAKEYQQKASAYDRSWELVFAAWSQATSSASPG